MDKFKKIEDSIQQIISKNNDKINPEELKNIFSVIDLTSLNTGDNERRVIGICEKVNLFKNHFPDIPNVAAICVYPNFIPTVKNQLKVDSVKIASVAAGFPSSQTFFEIKLKEVEMALSGGADEIDIVLPVGNFLESKEMKVMDEIKEIKKLTGEKHLKVILETGLLSDYELIYNAGLLAMESGADFIKTSTGKLNPAATLEAIFVMANSIKEYYKKTGKKTGIKPAGGISNSSQAFHYMLVIREILGDEWINNKLFRIGASRLANNLLTDIVGEKTGDRKVIQYF